MLTDPLTIVRKQDPPSRMKSSYLLPPFPNPAATKISFQLHLDESDVITLTVVDALGKEVGRLMTNERLNNGDHIFMFSTAELSSGTYYVILSSSLGKDTKAFNVIR